jgi:hypothetical protein
MLLTERWNMKKLLLLFDEEDEDEDDEQEEEKDERGRHPAFIDISDQR